MAQLTLYHGSSKIIASPTYGAGNPHNDYGLGFYCTESLDLAKEWGTSEQNDGFANKYTLDLAGLSTLNLNDGTYTILHWLAILLENRSFRTSGNIAPLAKEFLLERFSVNYTAADIIRGYRADDSYFSFANAFINNSLSLSQLEKAMMLGNLGEQVVIKSPKAFDALRFQSAEIAQAATFFPKKLARDKQARAIYKNQLRASDLANEVTILQIMNEQWGPEDARLRRIVS